MHTDSEKDLTLDHCEVGWHCCHSACGIAKFIMTGVLLLSRLMIWVAVMVMAGVWVGVDARYVNINVTIALSAYTNVTRTMTTDEKSLAIVGLTPDNVTQVFARVDADGEVQEIVVGDVEVPVHLEASPKWTELSYSYITVDHGFWTVSSRNFTNITVETLRDDPCLESIKVPLDWSLPFMTTTTTTTTTATLTSSLRQAAIAINNITVMGEGRGVPWTGGGTGVWVAVVHPGTPHHSVHVAHSLPLATHLRVDEPLVGAELHNTWSGLEVPVRAAISSLGSHAAAHLSAHDCWVWAWVVGGPTLAEALLPRPHPHLSAQTLTSQLHLDLPLPSASNSVCSSEWPEGWSKRQHFCHLYDGYSDLCSCHHPFLIPHTTSKKKKKNSNNKSNMNSNTTKNSNGNKENSKNINTTATNNDSSNNDSNNENSKGRNSDKNTTTITFSTTATSISTINNHPTTTRNNKNPATTSNNNNHPTTTSNNNNRPTSTSNINSLTTSSNNNNNINDNNVTTAATFTYTITTVNTTTSAAANSTGQTTTFSSIAASTEKPHHTSVVGGLHTVGTLTDDDVLGEKRNLGGGKRLGGEKSLGREKRLGDEKSLGDEKNLAGSDVMGDLGVVILASARPQLLYRLVRELVMQSGGGVVSHLVISIDGPQHLETVKLANLLGITYRVHQTEGEGSPRISRHMRFALFQALRVLSADKIIVLEEDLILAPDFITYMRQASVLLDQDPSLYAVSAYAHFAYTHTAHDPARLNRAHSFPAYGWMVKRSFLEETLPKWPPAFVATDWDFWMETGLVRREREVVVPELPRTAHHGTTGAHTLGPHQANAFTNKPLSKGITTTLNIHQVLEEAYERTLKEELSRAEPLNVTDPFTYAFPTHRGTIYAVCFRMDYGGDKSTFRLLARGLGVWSYDAREHHYGMWRLPYHHTVIFIIGVPFSKYSHGYLKKKCSILQGNEELYSRLDGEVETKETGHTRSKTRDLLTLMDLLPNRTS